MAVLEHFTYLTVSYTDCGAGIGRVSKELLLPIFTKVDLVEQNKMFLDNAPVYLVCIIVHNSIYWYSITI